jgi:hypothetical protein
MSHYKDSRRATILKRIEEVYKLREIEDLYDYPYYQFNRRKKLCSIIATELDISPYDPEIETKIFTHYIDLMWID